MPNRTIYVADADLPIFEKAQQLAGGNLSATIVQALRRYIEEQETQGGDADAEGFREFTLKVGKNVYTQKRFTGRLLAKARYPGQERTESFEIYQTPKANVVLYTKDSPNLPWQGRHGAKRGNPDQWADWANWFQQFGPGQGNPGAPNHEQWQDWFGQMGIRGRMRGGGAAWATYAENFSNMRGEFTLEVFATLEEMRDRVPDELYRVAEQRIKGSDVEVLDI